MSARRLQSVVFVESRTRQLQRHVFERDKRLYRVWWMSAKLRAPPARERALGAMFWGRSKYAPASAGYPAGAATENPDGRDSSRRQRLTVPVRKRPQPPTSMFGLAEKLTASGCLGSSVSTTGGDSSGIANVSDLLESPGCSASVDPGRFTPGKPPPRQRPLHSYTASAMIAQPGGCFGSPGPSPVAAPSIQMAPLGGHSYYAPAMSPGGSSVAAAAAAAAAASDNAVLRMPFKSRWPNLDIPAKDVEVMNWWHDTFEAPLAQALPDARCPYAWLDPASQGPREEALEQLAQPYSFADFRKDWDFPDDSGYQAWKGERVYSRKFPLKEKEKDCLTPQGTTFSDSGSSAATATGLTKRGSDSGGSAAPAFTKRGSGSGGGGGFGGGNGSIGGGGGGGGFLRRSLTPAGLARFGGGATGEGPLVGTTGRNGPARTPPVQHRHPNTSTSAFRPMRAPGSSATSTATDPASACFTCRTAASRMPRNMARPCHSAR